jgi:hypothetical protein
MVLFLQMLGAKTKQTLFLDKCVERFRNHITRHDTLPGPGFHASDIAWYLAWLILFIWSMVSVLYGYNAYKAFTKPGFPDMDYS